MDVKKVALVIALTILIAGCVIQEKPKTETPTQKISQIKGFPVTITDFAGRNVTIEKPPERVIVLQSYWAEVMHCLGLDGKIVGVSTWIGKDVYLPENVRNRTDVGTVSKGLNWETIVSLNPDLIIVGWDWPKSKQEEAIKKAEELDIPVIALTSQSVEDNIKVVEILGKVFGEEDRAKELADWMQSKLDKVKDIASQIPEEKRKNILYISVPKGAGGMAYVYSKGTAKSYIPELVGAHNLAFDREFNTPYPKLDLEKIIAYWGNKTDVLIIQGYDREKLEKTVEEIKKDARWREIKAVKEGHVYGIFVGPEGFMSWGPRIIVGVYQIGNIIYPEYYPNWKLVADELLQFYGKEFSFYRTIKDSFGREVRIPKQDVKAVILTTDYEILTYTLDTYEHVVGVGKYHTTNPILKVLAEKGRIPKDLPNLGSLWSGVNLEELVKLKPDCVITWAYSEADIEKIKNIEERTGIPVIAIDVRNLDDFYNAIKLLGEVFNKEEKAEEVIEEIKKEINSTVSRTSKVSADERLKTFLMYGVKGGKITTEGKDGVNIQLLKAINTIPATENFTQKYPKINLEQLYELNPDVIILFYMYKKEPSPEAIYNDSAWKDLKAVKERRICDLRGYYQEGWGSWNPTGIPLRVLAFAKCAYPDKLKDIDFNTTAQRLFNQFYGISYKEMEKRVAG